MTKYSLEQRQRIIALRTEGKAYDEINAIMGAYIPKGSMSYICRDVNETDASRYARRVKSLEILARGRKKALETHRRKLQARKKDVESKAELVLSEHISINSKKLALALLYLGEGSKLTSRRGLSLGSSSLQILTIYITLLEECYGKKREDLKARIQYRCDQDISQLQSYWAHALGFNDDQFYKTAPDMRTYGKPTQKSDYRGVCVITCGGVDIQLELAVIADKFAEKLRGHSSVD